MTYIIPTATSTFSDISFVTSDMFSSILPYLYVVIGIVLAFFVVETIQFWMSDYPERYRELEKKDRLKN